MCAWALGCFHSHISTQTFRRDADRVGGQGRGDKECPFSDVTKSGRVWRKVPESDARSVLSRFCWTIYWRVRISPKGRESDCKAMSNTDAGSSPRCGKGFYSQSTSSADSLTVPVQPPCAVACINICADIKNPKHWQL